MVLLLCFIGTLKSNHPHCPNNEGGGQVVRWCWVSFQCRGVLLIWIRVGQGPTALVVRAGGGCLDIFSLLYHFSFLSPSLWETARYRLKYCLKGPLSPKTTNQPNNEPVWSYNTVIHLRDADAMTNSVDIPAKFHDFSVMLTNLKDSHDLTIVF